MSEAEWLKFAEKQMDRFRRHVDLRGPIPSHNQALGCCHKWLRGVDKDGYGKFTVIVPWTSKGVCVRAHRVAFLVSGKTIPKGCLVLHKCDNESCVRVSHLYAGTQKQNRRDAIRRGNVPRGEAHHAASVTGEVVDFIRRDRAAGDDQRTVASRYGVTRSHVYLIETRRTWKHRP